MSLFLRLSLCLCIVGCASINSANKVVLKQDTYDFVSLKGITRNVAQTMGKDPYLVPKTEKDGGGYFDCRKDIGSRTVTFNGKKYVKLMLSDDYALQCPNIQSFKTPMPWKVTKTQWSAEDESEFGRWLQAIGRTKCGNVDECITHSANFLRSEEDMTNLFYSDCADFPYFMRSYFAYKKGLPYSFISEIAPRDPNDKKDLRYNDGNIPKARINVPSTAGSPRDYGNLSRMISDIVSSATFRMLDGDPDNGFWGDYYSPQISAQYVTAGTALYATNGHVALIYEVTPNGQIWFMDAHPGNSVTNKFFTDDEFVMDKIYRGGNFKNFRPLKLVNTVVNSEGVITKAQVQMASNDEIPGYSLEQYSSADFIVYGQKAPLSEWAKFKISNGKKLSPVAEIKDQSDVLCTAFQARAKLAQEAIDAKINKAAHITVLPNSIFGTAGIWERYSTPSADLRLRLAAIDLVKFSGNMIKRYNNKDQNIEYNGSDLKGDIIATYKKVADACTITYQNSAGNNISFKLAEGLNRLPRISFDPFLCPELRWGATSAKELSTCADNQTKKDWHKYTQYMRNNLVKDQSAFYGYTLPQLIDMDKTKKVDNNPNVRSYDILSGLQAL